MFVDETRRQETGMILCHMINSRGSGSTLKFSLLLFHIFLMIQLGQKVGLCAQLPKTLSISV